MKQLVVPYQNLYVYEVSGEVKESRRHFKDDFMGCRNEEGVSFLFFSQPHDQEVEQFAHRRGWRVSSKNVLDYKDWQAGEDLQPFKVGSLVICPPWEHCSLGHEELLIHVDPCVVFSSGHHPTTQSCLTALWRIYQRERPRKVLDLGTGTGILALAAAKWGAEQVMAVRLQ